MEQNPELSGVAAGLGCGQTWMVGAGFKAGDYILCPDEDNNFRIGEITGPYQYVPESGLPHRRPVTWLDLTISRDALSEELWRTVRVPSTVVDLGDYYDEITHLMAGKSIRPLISVDDTEVEDVMAFALESHLEEFIVENWSSTDFGKDYEIYKENGEKGWQISVTGGRLDILAVKKDQSELLVIELKKGRASDPVVGQILRYMSLVEDELAEQGQTVRGVIIALSDDVNIRHALKASKADIQFMRYEIKFNLIAD